MRTNKKVALNRSGWMKPVAIIGSAVGSVLAAALIFAWVAGGAAVTPSTRLDIALRQTQKGDILGGARSLDAVTEDELTSDEDRSKFQLLKGIRAYDQATKATLKQSYYAALDQAETMLKKSNELKFPVGFEGLGNYYLGAALKENNKLVEARPFLEESLNRFPQQRFDAIEKIVDIDLNSDHFDVHEVEKTIQRWSSFPAVTQDQLDRAQLALCLLRDSTGHHQEAIDVANAIAPESLQRPRADLFISEIEWGLLASEYTKVDGKVPFDEAGRQRVEAILQRLLSVAKSTSTSPQDRLRAKYLEAKCYRELGRYEEAISALSSLRSIAPQTIEGVAAAVEEVDLLAERQRWDDAIGTLRHLTSGFGDPKWYVNNWLTLQDLAQQLKRVGKRFLDSKAYAQSITFTEVLPSIIKKEDLLRIKAPAYEGWAEAENSKEHNQEMLTSVAAKHAQGQSPSVPRLFGLAAASYEELANLQLMAMDYPELLWRAIEDYSAAKDYVRSNALVDRYMQTESRNDMPKAFIKKGKNYFEMGQTDEALDALRRGVDVMPNHPLSYDARLKMAKILLEQFKYQEASEVLLENLYDGNLTPESEVWRNSLFELGLLYCRNGLDEIAKVRSMYDSASFAEQKSLFDQMQASQAILLKGIQRLEEAIQRYPNDDRVYYCLYRVAEGYRIAAEWPKLQLNAAKLASLDTREMHRQERDKLLSSAKKAYEQLRDNLNQSGDIMALDAERQRMLRNSYLGAADLLYETQQYEQALLAYRNAANRFLTEPIALEALTRAAQCSQQLGRRDEAIRALNQASDLLGRLDGNDPKVFEGSTRASKEKWAEFLDWLKQAI